MPEPYREIHSRTFFDALLLPVRGVILPLYDRYRLRNPDNTTITIPGWAVSDIRNTPVPYTVEHQYDFGYGGVYGPPDMPVKAGVVNQEQTIQTQQVHNGIVNRYGADQTTDYKEEDGFIKGPTKNVEVFVHMPFMLETDLPCSTNMPKY